MKFLSATVLLLFAFAGSHAQLYTTQGGSPLLLNPALTGAHNAALRINTIASPNWHTYNNWHYLMSSTSADYRTKSWGHGRQYAGIGLVHTYGTMAQGAFLDQTTQLSAAWHVQGGRKNLRQLSVGLSGGLERDKEPFYEDPIGPLPPASQYRIRTRYQLGAGITYSQQIGKRLRYIVGASTLFYGLDGPLLSQIRESFLDNKSYQTIIAGGEITLTNKWTLRPSLQRVYSFSHTATTWGTDVRYQPKQFAYYAGLWHSYHRVMAISAGVEHNRWRATGCYQYITNDAYIPTTGATLELGLQYKIWGHGRKAIPSQRY